MKKINLLDCTLRDGGRIIDCAFPDEQIKDIARRLSQANIDIVEVGFLRDAKKVDYQRNSTFFTDVDQIRPFVRQTNKNTMYVAFIDYGMFDFDTLKPYDGTSIDGVRVGFTKKDFDNSLEDVIICMEKVKKAGYKLFIQGVNSLGYSDADLLRIIDFVNSVRPYSFGIVDTYGAMYPEDIRRIFSLVDNNLSPDICMDFHSHNNYQLSFAFAIEMISLCQNKRRLIIDATLNGMGKCAGNLNTELIVQYMVGHLHFNYDLNGVLDIIDDYMYPYSRSNTWGFSIPAMLAGIYRSHPNNIIYLTEKFRMSSKDIKSILSMIDPVLRQRYDYDNIERLYIEYNSIKTDDKEALIKLSKLLHSHKLLLLMPGSSLVAQKAKIDGFIKEYDPIIISLNHVSDFGREDRRLAFFGSEKRYMKFADSRKGCKSIVVSNIHSDDARDIMVDYESLIERSNPNFDNTGVLLLNLLRRIGCEDIAFAGFDGYAGGSDSYYDSSLFDESRLAELNLRSGDSMKTLLRNYAKGLSPKAHISFITPSPYETCFTEVE